MKPKLSNIISYLEQIAPPNLAEDWDNIGLLVGDFKNEIGTILICLDITNEVVEEAININADLIIAHHPIIFKGIKNITTKDALGNKIIKCIKNDISVYALHTNFDMVYGGTNDILFNILGLTKKENLTKENELGVSLGRVGEYKEPVLLEELCLFVKERLNLPYIKFVGSKNKVVNKIGLATGSCSSVNYFIDCLNKGCDVFITSDIKHHEAIDALEMGLCLIDATHYATEFIIAKALKENLQGHMLENNFALEIYESLNNKPIFEYI